jgi:hypothetical protein
LPNGHATLLALMIALSAPALAVPHAALAALPYTTTTQTALFHSGVVSGTYYAPVTVLVADLNGDLRPDFVTATSDNAISVYLSNGSGGFQAPTSYTVAAYPSQVITADLNADGRLDLVLAHAGTTVEVLYGNGNGTFQAPVTLISAPTGGMFSVARGDFDSDGIDDVAAIELYDSAVVVRLSSSNSTVSIPGIPYPTRVASGDFNHDGISDLAVASNASILCILLGHGDGTFAPRVDIPCNSWLTDIACGHFDRDANLDLVAVDRDGKLSRFRGDGLGGFTLVSNDPIRASGDFYLMAAADLNLDGLQDLAVINTISATDNKLTILLNDGTGALHPQPDITIANVISSQSVAIGDTDGDGIPDLVVPGLIGAFILKGSTTGDFLPGHFIPNIAAEDAQGVTRHLMDYSNSWTLLNICDGSSSAARQMSLESQAVFNTFAVQNIPFEYVTLLVDGPVPGKTSSAFDAAQWAHDEALSRPILHSGGLPWSSLRSFRAALPPGARPVQVLLGPANQILAYHFGAMSGQETVNWITPFIPFTPFFLPLAGGSPAPPAPPAPFVNPPENWYHALSGATAELDYGTNVWSGPASLNNGSITFTSAQPPYASLLNATIAPMPDGGAAGGLAALCNVDIGSATEAITLGVQWPYSIAAPQTAHPYTVKLKNPVWADGVPRIVSNGKPTLVLQTMNAGTETDIDTGIHPSVSMTNGTLTVGPIDFSAVPQFSPTTFGFSVRGIHLRHPFDLTIATGVPSPPLAALDFAAPRPNPASENTALDWSLPRAQDASLTVFDVAGRAVRTLVHGTSAAGRHATAWDLRDDSGQRVAAGIYFARLRTAGLDRTQRMAVIR